MEAASASGGGLLRAGVWGICAGRGPPGSLTPPPRRRFRENAENMYYFSELALTLNEQEDGVAPTDSRLRPDQRLMEKGRWDEANTEKQRLEEKQRLSRRRRMETCAAGCGGEDEKESDSHMPLWFEKRLDPLTGEMACTYKGGYWEAKEKNDWHMCPNIF